MVVIWSEAIDRPKGDDVIAMASLEIIEFSSDVMELVFSG
jgi:hypothetical protein